MAHVDDVLAHLNKFGSIDPMTALTKLGVYRLAARIFDLREAGIQIHTSIEDSGAARYRLISNGTVRG